jgi:WD40 repeat protein
MNPIDHHPTTFPAPRRLPSPAAFAAILVALLGVSALILVATTARSSSQHVSSAATAVTVITPIQMVLVHGTDPALPSANGSIQLQGQTGPVLSLVFSNDDTMIAATDRAGNAHVWNRSGRLLATVTPASGLRISSVAFTVKDRQFVTVSSDGSVRFWPLPSDN